MATRLRRRINKEKTTPEIYCWLIRNALVEPPETETEKTAHARKLARWSHFWGRALCELRL